MTAAESQPLERPRSKLPIYDEPSQETILVKTELPLQPQVRWARQTVQSFKKDLDRRFDLVLDHGINIERKVVGTLSNLVDQKEASSSSILCVGIGAMTGSILARNRSLPIRFLSPLTFLLISSNHFLPSTTSNVKNYLFKLQDHHFPRSAERRDSLIRWSRVNLEWINHFKNRFLVKTTQVVKDGGNALQSYTGLNLSPSSKTKNQNE